jgi:hypothetical protein
MKMPRVPSSRAHRASLSAQSSLNSDAPLLCLTALHLVDELLEHACYDIQKVSSVKLENLQRVSLKV